MVNEHGWSRPLASLLCAAWVVSGCKAELEGRASRIEGERILAVRSIPAEAKPQASVQYEALYVGPDGALDAQALDWALCLERKPLAAPDPVAPACLGDDPSAVRALGTMSQVRATVPEDACATFGPSPPNPKPGQPPARAADPDPTGGYYQPVRVRSSDADGHFADGVGVTRLDCGLGGATQQQAAEFAMRHKPNENPALEALTLVRAAGEELALTADANTPSAQLMPAEKVVLRASWAACPSEAQCGDGICGPGESMTDCAQDCRQPHGCSGAEPYLEFERVRRELRPRREALRVSWFASAGEFDHERTGRAEDEADLTGSDDAWTAPGSEGVVQLWVVLRDDRGGVGWSSYTLSVAAP